MFLGNSVGRSLTRSPPIHRQPPEGPFEEKKNEILHFLTNIFTDGNGRFIRLRQFVGCTDEFAENDVESLMSNVSRHMMTDYKFGIVSFFENVVMFIRNEQDIEQAMRMELEMKVNDLTRLCFCADNLMGDAEFAIRLKRVGRNISVDIESEVAVGKSISSSIWDALKRHLCVFVRITANLVLDQIKRKIIGLFSGQSEIDNRDGNFPRH